MQPSLEEIIKPLRWLVGKWKSIKANGKYPTIKPFTYNEELEFKTVGRPMLSYCSYTEHPEKKTPMHLETGFVQIKPGTNQVAFMVANTFGISTLEEGFVDEEALKLELRSTSISSKAFAASPAVTELTRTYQFCKNTNQLELVICMATTNTPLVEHVRVLYTKC